ncbi:glycosyltransferase family 4 protein [Methylocapsa palsarum]|uniref:Glycosyltransferase involved in cell wall bisynthesis n=1 Tax=Methylocapsa palsarum TaxID=1612308 RepID=A0A1I4C901_9HYPH|nr:glycosyltransferase family 4 protein [Methylocapsa palsarum]SFK77110.1 Glycosyltransferase involved in cell wall bisynthesis [Methylocapsa palsarum]
MRILVYPHELSLGGSQINAIDLAAEIKNAGHDSIIYGVEGPLTEYIRGKGLDYHAAHPNAVRPNPIRIAQLARLCRRERIDLIHAYEWPPCLDAYYGAHLLLGVPVLCSVLSMWASPLVPDTVPLIMGTEALGDEVRRERRGDGANVYVLEPPIDIVADRPTTDGGAFRRQLGIADNELLVASVSRLSFDLKFDALTDAIDAAASLAAKWPIRLVLVGGGDAESECRRRADIVNALHNREVILLPGPSLDPRPAYAGADVVIGMGSSALRAMAHEKPLVVQGERGWALPCNPDTIGVFLHQGFFGEGAGSSGAPALAAAVERLLEDAERRTLLGKWGRETVIERFSLQAAAKSLIGMFENVRLGEPRIAFRRKAAAFAQVTGRAFVNELQYHLPNYKRRRDAELQRRMQDAVVNANR